MAQCSVIIALFLALVTAQAAIAGPVQVEADRMESRTSDNMVRFSGNVEARQDDLIIRAAEMEVFYRKKEAAAPGGADRESMAVDRITARGEVRLLRQGWIATGRELDYSPATDTAILTGKARVRQGNNLVSGERIVLHIKEGRSVVERGGEGQRVKAFFYPDSATGSVDPPPDGEK